MSAATHLVGARLLDPWTQRDETGDLLVIDGVIAALGHGVTPPEGTRRIDCAGACLAPGLVDMRVQLDEPGGGCRETIESGSRAAVSGGITTLVALPDTDPVIDEPALVGFVAARSRAAGLARILTYAAATRGCWGRELAEYGLLAASGAVGFTDGRRVIADALIMRRVLSYARTFDQLIIQHPEEPSLVAPGGGATEGEIATRLGLPAIPEAAEVIMVERDLRLVEITGARYHAAHLSTAAAIDAVRRAKKRGLPVTADTAPPYFALNEQALEGYDTAAKLSPPLRSEQQRQAVVEGLRDKTIDAIASDHAPQGREAKRLPFASAAVGTIGLETLFPLALELHHRAGMTLLQVLRALTQAPADLLRLPVGRLAVGAAADLVMFDPDYTWTIDAACFRSNSRNSAFDGRVVRGRVLQTMVAGRTVFALEPSPS